MPQIELELNPVDFITIGTVGPKGQRVFHLQGGKDEQLVSLIIEKEQAWALSEAITELLDDLDERFPEGAVSEAPTTLNMDLREPIEPLFRVAQMGLGYDEEHDLVVLVAQELIIRADDDDPDDVDPSIVRFWCSRDKMRALSVHSSGTVQSGRPDPRQNGRLIYYWT
ncbi:DUF3090 family protein [Anaerolineae bacterium CFX9]|jgi:uncharacterized repeat protein (TIGR03847 family)|nr:DUF3090 family protein [Anaerolineae bacterium CFX9]